MAQMARDSAQGSRAVKPSRPDIDTSHVQPMEYR